MAIIYVDTNASAGSANGTSWANAYLTIQAALGVWTIADEIWVASDSFETYTTTQTLTATNDTDTLRVPLYRVNSSTNLYDPTPQDTTGSDQIATTTAGDEIRISCNSAWYGFKFICASHFTLAFDNDHSPYFEDCEITYGTVTVGSQLQNFSDVRCVAINCYFRNILTADSYLDCDNGGDTLFIGCFFNSSAHVNGYVRMTNQFAAGSKIEFISCDFTLLSNFILVDASVAAGTGNATFRDIKFTNCIFKSTYVLYDTLTDVAGLVIEMDGCSVLAGSEYIHRRVTFLGEMLATLSSYRTGGYAEEDGDINLSLQLSSLSQCRVSHSIKTTPITGYINSTGNKTFTIELIENFTTALTERECWMEIQFYNNAASQRQGIDTTTKEFAKLTYTDLTAGTGLGDWVGEPSGSRSVKLSATVNVLKVGHYKIVVHLGKYELNKVVLVDPSAVIT